MAKKTVFQEYVPISPKSLTLKEEIDTHSEVRQKDTSKEKWEALVSLFHSSTAYSHAAT